MNAVPGASLGVSLLFGWFAGGWMQIALIWWTICLGIGALIGLTLHWCMPRDSMRDDTEI